MRKLENFTLFLDLPLEIRNHIWRMATPRERIVFSKKEQNNPSQILNQMRDVRMKRMQRMRTHVLFGTWTSVWKNKITNVSATGARPS
jgi:hypothetical protein